MINRMVLISQFAKLYSFDWFSCYGDEIEIFHKSYELNKLVKNMKNFVFDWFEYISFKENNFKGFYL